MGSREQVQRVGGGGAGGGLPEVHLVGGCCTRFKGVSNDGGRVWAAGLGVRALSKGEGRGGLAVCCGGLLVASGAWGRWGGGCAPGRREDRWAVGR